MACSNAEKASWTTDARTPLAPVSLAPRPGPDIRAARAAWQTGHHWHSSGSLGGNSVVAVSQTSPRSRRFSWPIVFLTWSATWLAMLRAPAFISQRWKSATGSLPRLDWLRLPDWPLPCGGPSLRAPPGWPGVLGWPLLAPLLLAPLLLAPLLLAPLLAGWP